MGGNLSLNTGLTQGEALWPMLPFLFINDLEREMVANCCKSLQLPDLYLVFTLICRRINAGILPKRRKIRNNQSINTFIC